MQIKLPPLGEGATSGTVSGIFVEVGERVSKDQPLIELESEKAVASIPAPSAGVVSKILVKEGDELKVGQPILELDGADTQSENAGEERISVSPGGELVESSNPVLGISVEPPPGFPPPASPSIRKLARGLGIDLRSVRGSKRGGRIVMEDLKAYIKGLQEKGGKGPGVPMVAPAALSIDFTRWGPVRREKLSTLRLTIGRRMTESWTTIPHVTQFDKADITDLLRLKEVHSPFYKKNGVRLTITPFILKALVDVLKAHPKFNASLDTASNELVFKDYYDFGIAVDTEKGLIVPVVRSVDQKSLLDLSLELEQIAGRARDRKITIEEMQGGTFTISNQGGIGGGHFTPIINAPEVAILGIGRGSEQTVIRSSRPAKRSLVPLALSYDHRVIDGADAARFITALVDRLAGFKDAEVRLVKE